MPFTPFHFGPGLALKAAAPGSFSWTAFVAAQVLIDCETLYYIATRQHPLHRELHTFVGATVAGLLAGAALAGLALAFPRVRARAESLLSPLRAELGARALIVGGLAGGASHPLLDGLMHPDIRPFAPFSGSNPLLGAVDLGALHFGCMAAGILGLAWLWVRTRR